MMSSIVASLARRQTELMGGAINFDGLHKKKPKIRFGLVWFGLLEFYVPFLCILATRAPNGACCEARFARFFARCARNPVL